MAHLNVHERDMHWPPLGKDIPTYTKTPTEPVTFAGMMYEEGTQRLHRLEKEILRLNAVNNDLKWGKAHAWTASDNWRRSAMEAARQRDQAVARANTYAANYDKLAEELSMTRDQLSASDAEIEALKKPGSSSRSDGHLARKNRELGAQLAEAIKNLEAATRRALVAEDMVQRQKNGIDALNADFCNLELKYVNLKNAQRATVMPSAPPPPHGDLKLDSPEDEEGWERVKIPFSDA